MNKVKLNPKQKEAVEHIYGPLLVLAGPGTGKTQLLSSRVANILQNTDVSASNILCLTFTEAGAQNMRDRLRSLIGDAAYDVTINTYHSFGSDVIKNYSEYFQNINLDRTEDIRLETPVDELTQIQIIEDLVSKLNFDSPLLSARYYIKSVVSTISDLKRNLITPDKLRQIASENLKQIEKVQPLIDKVVNSRNGFSRKKAEKLEQYSQLLEGLKEIDGSLIRQAKTELENAFQKYDELGSVTLLSEWKNNWLHKNDEDEFTLTERLQSEKMLELANVYENYEKELKKISAYDFDDMILRAIDGLENNNELRYNIQERYQFILLDEFQDTNPSQFELVKKIANHPIHEGKPNIMAVGDDDQAIFAFQGAHVRNMKDFTESFSEVHVINLKENYRSHKDILHVAHNVANQIEDRLHTKFENIDKLLISASNELPKNSTILRQDFDSEASEYSWVAGKVEKLLKDKTNPSEIAILAPKHKILENIVPFMKNSHIPITYEKRENILETEIVSGLKLVAKLVLSLNQRKFAETNEYFPYALSLPYWQIDALDIWKINWQFQDHSEKRSWVEIAAKNPKLSAAVEFYLSMANESVNQPLEIILDKITGTLPVKVRDNNSYSPLKNYYFNKDKKSTEALKYYEAISHLSVIRAKIRSYQSNIDKKLNLNDFLDFFTMYELAEEPLINTHPIAQDDTTVQLMTVYKAKGLEFEHVFILQAHDDVWGTSSKGSMNKLSLPPNLRQIRYANSSEDERKRLFYVALTRAKHGLYISSHTTKDNGKKVTPLKYLAESDGISGVLPEKAKSIIRSKSNPKKLSEDIETLWLAGQIYLPANFKSLLKDKLQSYKMSPTHLNSFINLEYAGPETFLLQTLLKFPQAPSASGEYGTAIHNTLEWYQNCVSRNNKPSSQEFISKYENEINHRYLSETDYKHALEKGKDALSKFIAERASIFEIPAKSEVNFYSEEVVLDDVKLSGKIDRLEINEESKTVDIVDYKTGNILSKWDSSTKSITYKQQLYIYKFLVENSINWRKYKVNSARLEFVEPKSGKIHAPLYLEFNQKEETEIIKLIKTVWELIQKLDLPEIDNYPKSSAGTKKFINDLIQ